MIDKKAHAKVVAKELIANCLKYGFSAKPVGKEEIEISKVEGGFELFKRCVDGSTSIKQYPNEVILESDLTEYIYFNRKYLNERSKS